MGSTAHTIQTAKRTKKDKSRWPTERHISVPHSVINNYRHKSLSGNAVKLLEHLCLQLNGYNNGDIAAAQKLMAPFGWADSTRKRALKQLVENELLSITRVGGKHRCQLYAVTWLPIDECKNKLDVRSTQKQLIDFKAENYRAENQSKISKTVVR